MKIKIGKIYYNVSNGLYCVPYNINTNRSENPYMNYIDIIYLDTGLHSMEYQWNFDRHWKEYGEWVILSK